MNNRSSDSEAIENALAAVLRDNSFDAFAKAFGPRRLMKLLAAGGLSDRAVELADEILALDTGAGLASGVDLGDVYKDEIYPDVLVPLALPARPPPPPAAASAMASSSSSDVLRLHVPMASCGSAYFAPQACRMCFDAVADTATADDAPTLRLHQLSRRARLGSEIECKVWPAALILGRWLWLHRPLLAGKCALELGCGVGTAGLAAALCGARRVVLTDINATALRCARENCRLWGPRAGAATRRPPPRLQPAPVLPSAPRAPLPLAVAPTVPRRSHAA